MQTRLSPGCVKDVIRQAAWAAEHQLGPEMGLTLKPVSFLMPDPQLLDA